MLASVYTLWETESPVVSDDILSSPHVGFDLGAWMPGTYEWNPIEHWRKTNHDGLRPITFEVDTIDLPTPDSRWKPNMPGHPELTFDDLRLGNLPKLTQKEIETRQKALELARSVHDKLDIRPLATSAIIRKLRQGQ